MRPALFRLLKRPSALSVLDALVKTPFGIEQLDSGFKSRCLRCHAQNVRQANPIQEAEFEPPVKNEVSRAPTRPFSFRVYEIQPSTDKRELETQNINSSCHSGTTINLKRLGLQPDKLEYESDVGHISSIGTRLVDDPTHRGDFSLWEELLRYRQRRYGDNGTLDIWEGLMTRVGDLQLPVTGERADLFWQSFVELGIKREAILKELANYALDLWNTKGKRWDMFYLSVVAGFLERGMTRQAVEWHRKLQTPHLSSPNEIVKLLKASRSLTGEQEGVTTSLMKPKGRPTPPGLLAFREICKSTGGHQIYGPVISTLISDGDFTEVFRMHKFLVDRGDHPQSYEDFQPLLEHARKYGPYSLYEKLHRYVSGRFEGQPGEISSNAPSAKGQSAEPGGEVWLEEKQFKDEFGARIFATKALNFETIVSGLKMFGVPAIGPRSLREMATRARGSQDITDKLRHLEKEKISVGDSLFARLLRKLAAENREILVSDLLHSDQHPDVLEDAKLQESLLLSYYTARDWRPYNLTLAVLGELHGEGPELPNIHFRKYIAAGELILASKVVDEMTLQGIILSKESIDFMIKHALRLRKPGTGPALGGKFGPKAEVTFVCRILQRIVPMGADVSPKLWVEMIKRLGMTDNWKELRTCCLWLSRHYSSVNNKSLSTIACASDKAHLPKGVLSRQAREQMLQSIFTRQMQAAIVAWGFKIQPPTKLKTYPSIMVQNEKLVPYVRGLLLLREMERNGMNLHLKLIHQACRQRLTVLFGRPRQSSRPMNRELRKNNPYGLQQVVTDINRAWGGNQPLLDYGANSDPVPTLSPHVPPHAW